MLQTGISTRDFCLSCVRLVNVGQSVAAWLWLPDTRLSQTLPAPALTPLPSFMFESSFLYRPSLIPGCLLYSTYTAIPLCLLQGWPHLDSSRTPLGRFSAKRHKCIYFVQLLVPNYFAGQLRAPQRTSLTEKPLQCKRRFYVGLFKVFLRTHRAISVAAETCTLKTIYK